LSGKLVSIDLGSKNFHLICGRHKGKIIEVDRALAVPIPVNSIKNGRIEDIYSLKSLLKDVFNKNRIKNKNVVLTIQSTSIITRDIVLPFVNQEDLDNMVKFEIEQYLPIVASEYTIEYTFLEEFKEEESKKIRIRVAAMPQSMVDNYFNLLKESGLKPIALDIHCNAVSKLFANIILPDWGGNLSARTYALIDLGHQNIAVHIFKDGKIDFSRIITLGGSSIDEEISEAYSLTMEMAEEKKIKEGYLNREGNGHHTNDFLSKIMTSRIEIWIAEIYKIFQYYLSRSTENVIDTVLLYGGSSRIRNIEAYFERVLNINVRKPELTQHAIKTHDRLGPFDPGCYINALGGIIRYE
jgi:type IV pilus assembly protein PilM